MKIRKQLTLREYVTLCLDTAVMHWKAILLPLIGVAVLSIFIRLDVNMSESLPAHVFITIKGYPSEISHGDVIVFEWEGKGGPYPPGFHFAKIVAGIPGDVVEVKADRNFYIHRRGVVDQMPDGSGFVARAKEVSKKGVPLELGPVGKIPPDRYFVFTPHVDSLDSRYAITGWIRKDQIIGKTFAFF